MARLFISHSSRNDAQALALEDWLLSSGWGKEDIYLDISPDRGMAAGQRWVEALDDAQRRCEAIIFLVSKEWLSAKWCREEYDRALQLNKKMFALIIDNGVDLTDLPQGLTSQWQAVSLVPQKGIDTPTERFDTEHPITRETDLVRFTTDGLTRLRHGLTKAAIAPESFSLQKEAEGPLGWRMPYRGLEPLEDKDAAVFFGRDAEITQGLDVLRGLASKNPPRFMVILGASGAGKSSYLRAGLLPRLERDDTNWLPIPPLRSGDDGPIEAPEGLLAQLQTLHQRLGLESSRASLRRAVQDEDSFAACLQTLRQAAHRAALLDEGRDAPLPVLSIDQAEELFVSDAHDDTARFLKLVREAMMAGELTCIATIRSDRYSALQSEAILEGIDQTTFSLPPVMSGQLSQIINGPALVWRREAGPAAPIFAPEVSKALMEEISGQQDALPLLAFAMVRLINDHIGSDTTVEAKTITLEDLKATGGVAKTIEIEADKALGDAGIDKDPKAREGILRDTFIPRLARVDKDSRDFERRVASLSDFSGARLRDLVNAFVERRLLTLKARDDDPSVEVAHEALLRKWPTLSKILDAEKEDLIRLDTALNSAAQWEANGKAKDYIDHRGGRLEDLKALSNKSPEWNAALMPAKEYVVESSRVQKKRRNGIRSALGSAAVMVIAFFSTIFWQQRHSSSVELNAALALINQRGSTLPLIANNIRDEETKILVLSEGSNHNPILGIDTGLIAKNITAFKRVRASQKIEMSDLIYKLFFSHDGSKIYSATGSELGIWDSKTGKNLYSKTFDEVIYDVTTDVISNFIIVSTGFGEIHFIDEEKQEIVQKLKLTENPIMRISIDSKENKLLAASRDQLLSWDLTAKKKISEFPLKTGDGNVNISFSKDNSKIVIAESQLGKVSIWDINTKKEFFSVELESYSDSESHLFPYLSPENAFLAVFKSNARPLGIYEINGSKLKLKKRETFEFFRKTFSAEDGWFLASLNQVNLIRKDKSSLVTYGVDNFAVFGDNVMPIYDSNSYGEDGTSFLKLITGAGYFGPIAMDPNGKTYAIAIEKDILIFRPTFYRELLKNDAKISLAVQDIDFCLSPQDRVKYQLSPDPPCWCQEKNTPPLSIWEDDYLLRNPIFVKGNSEGKWPEDSQKPNPFTHPRSDGWTCPAKGEGVSLPWADYPKVQCLDVFDAQDSESERLNKLRTDDNCISGFKMHGRNVDEYLGLK